MPKVEKAIHLQAFRLYLEMGGMSPAFLQKFGKEFGRSGNTAYRWAQSFGWNERAKKPVDEAIENLETEQVLNTEEFISGLLDLCRSRMEGLATQSGSTQAIFASIFDRIVTDENPNPENPLEVKSIFDLKELVLAQSRLIKDEQGYMRILLTLIGSPERITEDRMIVEFIGMDENVFRNAEQSVADDSTNRAADEKTENKT